MAQFKHARCKATNLIRKTKRNYFCDKIDENKGNPKGIWKAIRSLTGTGKSQVNGQVKSTTGHIGDEIIADKSLIVNELICVCMYVYIYVYICMYIHCKKSNSSLE